MSRLGKWVGKWFALVVLVGSLASSGLAQMPPLVLPEDAPLALVASDTLLTFEEGSFLESVVVDDDGVLYVTAFTLTGNGGQIWRVSPEGEGEIFAEVQGGNLAFHPDGMLYATVQSGDFSDPSTFTVSLSRFSTDGEEQPVLTFPTGSTPNGIVFDGDGTLYSADSQIGVIWRVVEDQAEVWLEDELLLPQGPQGIPGANGIKVFGGAVYTVNSSSGDFLRIPIEEDGAAGEIEVVATGVTGDGFAFDDDGIAYVTTHPFNTLVKVYPDGSKEIVGNADNGIVGATDAAFGSANPNHLYVVHDGGLFTRLVPPERLAMFPETSQIDFLPPALVRLDLSTSLDQ